MSIGTVTGFVAGLALFLLAIVMATDDYMIFWSGTSIIMVLGGTLANAFISYQGVYVIAAVKDVFTIYGHAKVNRNILVDEVKRVLEWADIVGKKGIVGLDQHLKDHKAEDHLVDYAIDILLSGYKPESIRELLTNTIESAFERATLRVKVLENMAATAPRVRHDRHPGRARHHALTAGREPNRDRSWPRYRTPHNALRGPRGSPRIPACGHEGGASRGDLKDAQLHPLRALRDARRGTTTASHP